MKSDSFLRDDGLLPRQVLECSPQPKVFAGDLPSLGVHKRPNWPFLPRPTWRERAQRLLFNFNLKDSFVLRRERKFLSTETAAWQPGHPQVSHMRGKPWPDAVLQLDGKAGEGDCLLVTPGTSGYKPRDLYKESCCLPWVQKTLLLQWKGHTVSLATECQPDPLLA